ncbi:YidC/Oxa1 family membrane protein insertase [bacterium]|nr:YidC/Oxa1 family membrane protein insertase [bacterium]
MNKLFKTISILFFALILLTFTACGTNFCSHQDIDHIVTQVIYNYDHDDGSVVDVYHKKPTTEEILKSKVTSDEGATWEALAGTPSANKDWAAEGKTLQYDYAYKIYKDNHPKTCLVTKDHYDKITKPTDGGEGAYIEPKSFGYAFSCGLLEILAYPVSWGFTTVGSWFGGSGIALIGAVFLVTFIIRTGLLGITWRSTKQTQRLQMIQPQLNAIAAKYANRNDESAKAARARETMDLYKKHKINPISSLIAPFLTFPVFIAVYGAVKDTAMIHEATIFNISLGAHLGDIILKINFFGIAVFLLMIVSQFVSMKISQWLNKARRDKRPGMQGGLNQQNFMTYFFLIMIVIIGWMLPIAMSLYWIASSWFSILQAIFMQKFARPSKLSAAR